MKLLAALSLALVAACAPAYAQTDGVPLRGPSGQPVSTIKGTACTQSGRTLTCNAGAGGTGSPGGLVNELQKNDGAGGFAAYAGTTCGYAVKSLNSTGAATCTAAPSIPSDISGAHYVTTQAEAGLSAEAVLPTCTGNDKLTFNGTTISCGTDQDTVYTLPAATASVIGGVKGTGSALTCAAGQKATGFASDGTLQCATDADTVYTLPAMTATVLGGVKGNGALACSGTDKLSGFTSGGAMVCSSDADTVYTLPTPTASTLGGVKSLTCSGTDKLSAIGTDGIPVCSTDQTGSGGGAPTGATYITQTPDATLTAEQAMSTLGTGLVKNTTTTGVQSIYGGTSCTNQFPRSLDASGAATCASVSLANDTTGTLAVGKGGSGLTTVAADQVFLGTAADTFTAKSLPSCSTAATSKLLYNTTTHAFSCGTDQTSAGAGYANVFDDGSPLPNQTTLNFIGDAIACADNATQTDCTVTAISRVQDEGTLVTARSTLNFTGAGVSCVDNAGSSRTDCTISGGSGGPTLVKVSGSNFTNSTVTPAAITGLSWTVAASTESGFRCTITHQGTATSGPRFGIQFGASPTNPVVRWHRATSATADTISTDTTSSTTQTAAITTGGVTSVLVTQVEGSFVSGVAGATAQIYLTSSTAGQTVTVFRGSHCVVF